MSSASPVQIFAASAIGGSTATDGNGQSDTGCRPHANDLSIGVPWALGVSGHSSSAATMPPLLEAARANWQSGAQPQSNASRDQLPRVSSPRVCGGRSQAPATSESALQMHLIETFINANQGRNTLKKRVKASKAKIILAQDIGYFAHDVEELYSFAAKM
eukprot:2386896-Pyramimonas_sp.AAC.1